MQSSDNEVLPRVSHVEWLVTDLGRSELWFRELFGFQFQPFAPCYRLYTPECGSCVGLMQVESVTPSSSPLVHIEVDSIDLSLARGVELGAEVAVPRREIPDYGWYAQLRDWDGNLIGLFEAKSGS